MTDSEQTTSKIDELRDTRRSGAAPLDPVEVHPERFQDAGPGTLAERGPLLDEDGDDIRQYTGEPVETEQGWVVPQQQNFAGKDNIAGGGEWPDPNTPPVQATTGDEDTRPSAASHDDEEAR